MIVTGCGLAVGLYRGRYLRGSRDEVAAVASGQPADRMLPGRGRLGPGEQGSVPCRRRSWARASPWSRCSAPVTSPSLRGSGSRPPAPTAEKIIVFGAGDAGAMLIYRLATQPDAAYQPVAILDDDPTKRRLRIHGVPVLGGRGQMTEVAASTGARMLVIAIAGGSGTRHPRPHRDGRASRARSQGDPLGQRTSYRRGADRGCT